MTVDVRPAVRGILLTPHEEVLLCHGELLDGSRLWVAPGGGLEDGEEVLTGLSRELREETGFELAAPVNELWHRTHTWLLRGRWVEQRERYFLVRTDRFDASEGSRPDEYTKELRWWSVADICASRERFVPRNLGHLLLQLRGGLPVETLHVGV